jgi:cell division septation protein DedD
MNRSKNLIQICAMALFVATTATACASFGSGFNANRQQTAPTDFRVRVGLYSRSGLDVARKVESNLRDAGYEAYLRRVNSRTHGLYVGRDLERGKADSLRREIDRLLDTKTLVVSM